MRLAPVLLAAAFLASCTASTAPAAPTPAAPEPQLPSSAPPPEDPRAPLITLRWVEKRLPTIIKGQPRRRLTLQLSGAQRELVPVGTFNGERFDLTGTFVNAENALLKASIGWNGSGNEIWVERADDTTLAIRHRDIDERRPYLTVDRVLTTVRIVPGARVSARQ